MEAADLEDGGKGDAKEDGEHFPEAGHRPHVGVEFVGPEAQDRYHDVDGQEPEGVLPVLFRDLGHGEVKTQPKPHKRSQNAGYDVHEDEQQRA